MVDKTCQNCKQSFKIENWRLKDPKRGKFCSIKCTRKFNSGDRNHFWGRNVSGELNPSWKGGLPNCVDCDKKMSVRKAKRCHSCAMKLISGENHYLWGKKRPEMSGEKHFNWKGGISSVNEKERVRFKSVIQNMVFNRDNYTCQICHKKGGILHADHIQSFSDHVESRFDKDNCRTLCRECHYFVTFGKLIPNGNSWGTTFLRKGVD